jgi:hypothetical protein
MGRGGKGREYFKFVVFSSIFRREGKGEEGEQNPS